MSYQLPRNYIGSSEKWAVVQLTIKVIQSGIILYPSLEPEILDVFLSREEALDFADTQVGLIDVVEVIEEEL